MEHPPLNDLDEFADFEHVGRNAAHLHIRVSACADQRYRNDADDLLCDQRLARGIACDTWFILHQLYGIESDAAHHFSG